MQTVDAAEFKERFLALLDTMGPDGIVITKHGRPVAKLIPIAVEAKGLIGSLAGKLRIRGKILSTRLVWEAESRRSRPRPHARH